MGVCPSCGTSTVATGMPCPACRDPAAASAGPLPESVPHTGPLEGLSGIETRGVGGETPTELPVSSTSGALAPGRVFGGRYRIIRVLGSGGMGTVYQAWDDELGLAVALKVIRADVAADPLEREERERRFKRELVLARAVTHPNVIRIHDLGEVDGIKYITMPFVQGETLAALLKRAGRLSVPRVLAIARQVVAGMRAAHQAGIVHRDLKPANIMITGEDQALILDFGIARRMESGTALTAVGLAVGTRDYMAPEQAAGLPVDQRADIFAFGLILSETLVGRGAARSTESAVRELMSGSKEAPVSLRDADSAIPAALDEIAGRCLRSDPASRYQTAVELGADLDRLDDDGRRRPDDVEHRPAGRQRLFRLTAAGLLGMLALVAVWAGWRHGSPPPPAQAVSPTSVLIADFDNQTADPVFDGSLEQALTIAVEGASFITVSPHADAESLLSRIKPGSKLDEAGARLIARRDGIKLVLAGSIARRGPAYELSVRVVEPSADRPSAIVRSTASSKGDVLQAVGAAAAEVRQSMGDTASRAELAAAAETFTAGSVEAMHDYSLGQQLLLRGKDEEAITEFQRAIDRDPQFGRAYAGRAVAAFTLGRPAEAAEPWKKALSLMDRMTDREKYRTLGSYYLAIAQDYEKAAENYETLTRLYPADTAGHANLALAYLYLRNFPKALAEARRSTELWPGALRFRTNYSLIAMYAGELATAAKLGQSVVAEQPSSVFAHLPMAMAATVGGQPAAARQAYESMARAGTAGASIASGGLADLALYEGNPAAARGLLARSIPDDEKAGNTAWLAAKLLALAEASAAMGDRPAAEAAVTRALTLGRGEDILVPAARLGLLSVQTTATSAADLNGRVGGQARAYGKVAAAAAAARREDWLAAIDTLRSSLRLADLWLARYDLGVACVRAGLFAEALSEFETCDRRRGEATAIFFDDLPTIRYLAPLQYWLGRAQEGVGMQGPAAEHYKAFINLRPTGSPDALAADARQRLARGLSSSGSPAASTHQRPPESAAAKH